MALTAQQALTSQTPKWSRPRDALGGNFWPVSYTLALFALGFSAANLDAGQGSERAGWCQEGQSKEEEPRYLPPALP